MPRLLIAGGGIGGLAAALACSQAGARSHGLQIELLERTPQFEDAGAGIQLGPNATRRLQAWGLGAALAQYGAFPAALVVRDGEKGGELARLPLGDAIAKQYGAPYACLHRSDLHSLLLDAALQAQAVDCLRDAVVTAWQAVQGGVEVQLVQYGQTAVRAGQALVGADGLWSAVRGQCLGDGLAQPTGHLAWRAMVQQARLPLALRSQDISVWLGPQWHGVAYPVRGGDWLNLVVITHASAGANPSAPQAESAPHRWSQDAAAADLLAALPPLPADLHTLLLAMPQWRQWVLCERAPLCGPQGMHDARWAGGRVALLGDAAHPMRPYLAQGAGMAIEDAFELAAQLQPTAAAQWPQALAAYAQARWQRNARVQARATRNGRVFHATGWQRAGRDAALRLLGARLLGQPWLYGY